MMCGMVMVVMTMLAATGRLGGVNCDEHSSGEGQNCR